MSAALLAAFRNPSSLDGIVPVDLKKQYAQFIKEKRDVYAHDINVYSAAADSFAATYVILAGRLAAQTR